MEYPTLPPEEDLNDLLSRLYPHLTATELQDVADRIRQLTGGTSSEYPQRRTLNSISRESGLKSGALAENGSLHTPLAKETPIRGNRDSVMSIEECREYLAGLELTDEKFGSPRASSARRFSQ